MLTIGSEDKAQIYAAWDLDVLLCRNDDVSLADCGAIAELINNAVLDVGADVVLLSSDRRGKELAGRVSALLDAGCLSDVNGLIVENGEIICQRNALGGATLAKQVIMTPRQVIAVAAKTFPGEETTGSGSIREIACKITPTVEVMQITEKKKDAVDVGSADLIVAIGQGVEEEKYVADVETIATALGGVVACTKPLATDRKWFAEDRIIGLSGAICKPSLAILLGISGQVQFAVGLRGAKKIICINTDEEADMVRMSDYYCVADAAEVIQQLKDKLQ